MVATSLRLVARLSLSGTVREKAQREPDLTTSYAMTETSPHLPRIHNSLSSLPEERMAACLFMTHSGITRLLPYKGTLR